MAATEMSRNIQTGARGATDSFNRFVEGPDGQQSSRVEPERRDFWDSFSTIGEERERQRAANRRGSGAIGTGAMKRAATTTTMGTSSSTAPSAPSSKAKDDWDDNW